MKSITDDVLLHRFLDGEMAPAQAAAFEVRLAAEPSLRERCEREQSLRAGFAAGRAAGRRAPAGFTAALVAAARRLPSRDEMQAQDVASSAMQFCRRLLYVAAILSVVGLAFQFDLFDRGGSKQLHAAPDEVQQEMDRLDALVGEAMQPSGK